MTSQTAFKSYPCSTHEIILRFALQSITQNIFNISPLTQFSFLVKYLAPRNPGGPSDLIRTTAELAPSYAASIKETSYIMRRKRLNVATPSRSAKGVLPRLVSSAPVWFLPHFVLCRESVLSSGISAPVACCRGAGYAVTRSRRSSRESRDGDQNRWAENLRR